MNYFESLNRDMTTLGINSEPYFSYVLDYIDAKILVESISHNLKLSREEVESTDSSNLITDLAKRALMLTKNGVVFDDTYPDCCEEAEQRLLEGISPYAISNSSINSPIVVTHEHEPVGVIKRYKIRTMYGITDVPEHGIVSGAFHRISNDFSPEAPSANHAWSVALEAKDAPTFEPVRLSVFTIPLEERLKLLEYEDPNNTLARLALQGSHEAITQSVIHAHANAVAMHKEPVPVLS